MISIDLIILLALSVSAGVLSFLLTLHHWEYRRLARSRLRERSHWKTERWPQTSLIVPVKGEDVELEQNLRAAFCLDYPNYEVVFVVESEEDPAAAVIRRLLAESTPVPARLVIAQLAAESGQKIHNLLVATERLGQQCRVLAFLDADARPSRLWLKSLMSRIYLKGNGAATGYRWFIPQRTTLANLLLYSINSSVAALLGRHDLNVVWGGSWAIRHDTFARVGMRGAWQGTLSDDLVATRVLREAGLRIEFEPGCLCPSPVDVNWSQLVEFLRRQFLIGRSYVRLYWVIGLAAVSLLQFGFWINLMTAVYWWWTGNASWMFPALTAAALYLMGAFRGWLRQDAARRCLASDAPSLTVARQFDIWLAPLAGLLAVLTMLSSAIGSCIQWRGNRYRIFGAGQIELLDRPSDPASPPLLPHSQDSDTRQTVSQRRACA